MKKSPRPPPAQRNSKPFTLRTSSHPDDDLREKPTSLFPPSPLQAFVFGLLIALLLTAVQAQAVGGIGGMLLVGEVSELADIIEQELGPVPRAPGGGHDGQMTFAIASDLTGELVAPTLDHAGYRYRRILLPVLASGFGLIDGYPLLYSLVAVNAFAFAGACAAMAVILRSLQRSAWGLAGVIGNPGLWLSINLVTVDVLAFALGLTGVALSRNRRHALAAIAMALAALAKDQYLVVAGGLAVFQLLRRHLALAATYALAGVPLLAWSAYLNVTLGSGFSPRSNFGPPFLGVIESIGSWSFVPASDAVYSSGLFLATVAGLIAILHRRNRQFWPIAAPWLVMAITASSWVWLFGNNAVRSLAPVLTWLVFAVVPSAQRSES